MHVDNVLHEAHDVSQATQLFDDGYCPTGQLFTPTHLPLRHINYPWQKSVHVIKDEQNDIMSDGHVKEPTKLTESVIT